jgi:hypothetical protein
MDQQDLIDWADTNLPDLYDPGMFDLEETSEDVWESVDQVAHDTVLEFIEDAEEREAASEQLTDVARDWFAAHHATLCESVPPAPAAEMADLQAKPQVSQHSADWYAQRRNRLTASEFAQILDGRRDSLLRSKIAPLAASAAADRAPTAPVAIAQPDGEMVATSWGHRFEPIVRDLFELESAGVGTVCDTLGRFTHTTIPWLSASPDGVVLSGPLAGRLVEIKSPKTRVPGTFVPDEYYIQMQIQMEVCDRDAVEFVEAQFIQRPTELMGEVAPLSAEDSAACSAARWKGVIEVYGYLEQPETWIYRYSRPVEDIEDLDDTPQPAAPNLPRLESSVWWLKGWFPRTVLRNRDWWNSVGWPAAELFWAQVESGRQAPAAETDKIELVGWIGRD